MNIKRMLPLATVLALGVIVANAQAADREYECVVKDSGGERLLHTVSGNFGLTLTSDVYTANAENAVNAEAVAIAAANKEHKGKAVSASCIQRPDLSDVRD